MRLLARRLGNPVVFILTAAAVAADAGYWRLATAGHTSLLGGESLVPTRAAAPMLKASGDDSAWQEF